MYYIVNKGTKFYSADSVIFANSKKSYCERFLEDGQIITILSNRGGEKVFIEQKSKK